VLLVQNVSKIYRLYNKPSDQFAEFLRISRAKRHSDFWALTDISFSVERGEVLGLIGPNGGGKSTLLQIISGILQPTYGRVMTRGRVAAILELGAGFNPDFTGRENVMINGELLGLSRAEMSRALPDIEEFAGIGEFIDRPVKEYSSGMYVRLAFSTAIHVEPEILIVDEALAVGDASFANRCIRKFQDLRERRVTVVFVSHDMGLVKKLSDRALFLQGGRVQAEGDPKKVVDCYVATVTQLRDSSEGATDRIRTSASRHGDWSSEILEVWLSDENRERCTSIESGQRITVSIRCGARKHLIEPQVGILVRSRIGMDVYGTNTQIEGIKLGSFAEGEEFVVQFSFDCWLTPNEYALTAAVQNADGTSQDWLNDALTFDVISGRHAAGVVDLRAEVEWTKSGTYATKSRYQAGSDICGPKTI